jgi:leucyl/phenylalanyl-tRNA--protein transferase
LIKNKNTQGRNGKTKPLDRVKRPNLNPYLIIAAYTQGYFPMPDDQTGDINWFRPNPRAIFPLDEFHVSRSLKKSLRREAFFVSTNQAFSQVVELCADRPETWINEEIKTAYRELHQIGHGHSIEIWDKDGALVGGVYGVSLQAAFFAESMFHRKTDASKIALWCLVEHLRSLQFKLLECQFMTDHLRSLGAEAISDGEYLKRLDASLNQEVTWIDLGPRHSVNGWLAQATGQQTS